MSHTELTEAESVMVRHARVAHLATAGPDGTPHVLPVCPVLDGDHVLIASDESAKLRNLRADPRVALVVDDYLEDWDALRRVLVWGTATVILDGPAWVRGRGLLYEKFQQYEPQAPIVPGRTVMVRIAVERVSSEGV